ncbi:MAG TPA: hypothetical protein PKA37_08600, partial [Planctomycetota bacterium]|nr:hypothetical protein [Planctomycetota bacterium]
LEHVVWNLATCEAVSNASSTPALPPDVPWFLLQTTACLSGPPFLCGPGAPNPYAPLFPAVPFTTAPYTALSTIPGNNLFDPNSPSTTHDNVTRYWTDALTSPPVFYLRARGVDTAAVYNGSNPIAPFPLVNSSLNPYTWADLYEDMVRAFDRYTDVPTAALGPISVIPIYSDGPLPGGAPGSYATYDPPGVMDTVPPLAGAMGGITIWDEGAGTGQPLDGPTGNGFNEILVIQNRQIGLGAGLCSMLADPATGKIQEADIIFDGPALSQRLGTFTNQGGPFNPARLNGFSHEVGHALGLDHTNLHAGIIQINANQPQPVLGFAASLTGSYGAIPFGSDLRDATQHSGITAQFMMFTTEYLLSPIFLDDRNGISRAYPVLAPGMGKTPLINRSATIQGQLLTSALAPDHLRNILANVVPWGTPLPQAWPAAVGTISGTARRSPSDVTGVRNAGGFFAGSGAYRLIGLESPSAELPATLPAQNGATGVDAYILVESLESVGHGQVGPATLGEWFYEPFLNSFLNLWLPVQVQYTLISRTAFPLALRPIGPGIPPIPSLALVQGTLLDLNITAPVLSTGGAIAIDPSSRPLIEISPRSNPFAGSSILVRIDANYAIAKLQVTINGIPIASLDPYAAPGAATFTGTGAWAFSQAYQIPTALLPASGPIVIEASARETIPPAAGVSSAIGRNEVRY